MIALFNRDRATTRRGDVGLMETDPVCDCQDWEHLTVQSVDVKPTDAAHVDATVTFTSVGEQFVIRYDLVAIGGRWRVRDIQGKGRPSLRKFLIDGLAQRRAGKPV